MANSFIILLLVLLGRIVPRLPHPSRPNPFVGAGVTFLIALLYVVLSYLLFKYLGLWIDVFLPLVVIFAGYLGSIFSHYLQEKRKREIMENELGIARQIQDSFLPLHPPCSIPLKIAGKTLPARIVGGDFYDFIEIDEERTGIVIGDISGKGVPSALYMAKTISIFRSKVRENIESEGRDDVGRILEKVNISMTEEESKGMFATVLYLMLDRKKTSFSFANAGHLLFIIVSEEPNLMSSLHKRDDFCCTGFPLGVSSQSRYPTGKWDLRQGEALVLFTDGVTETRNKQGEFFGEERIEKIVRENLFLDPQEIIERIVQSLQEFSKGIPQSDDITLVVIKRQ